MERETHSQRGFNGLNFQIKSRKISTLLCIYIEGEEDLRGTRDERSGKVRRDGDRRVDKQWRSQDGGEQLRRNREVAHCVTVTKLGAEAPYEKGSIHQGQEDVVRQHHVMGQEAK